MKIGSEQKISAKKVEQHTCKIPGTRSHKSRIMIYYISFILRGERALDAATTSCVRVELFCRVCACCLYNVHA